MMHEAILFDTSKTFGRYKGTGFLENSQYEVLLR
jgi:hypothetical protein